jgi:beta-ketoacyl-acyl-carrier-protein synthase II
MMNRVVVTGMGTVNPIGLSVAESWENLINGKSGVGPITLIDASDLQVQIACEVKGFEPELYQDAREARRQDRFEHLAIAAAEEAVADAGLDMEKEDPSKVAVIVSTAIGGIKSFEEGVVTLYEKGARRISPFLIPMFMPNGPGGMIAIRLGAKGPNFSVSSACASGADGLGQSWMLIRNGAVEVAIAGGTESTITKLGIGAFDRLGALSRRNDDYSMTPAPFDKNRDGLVMGEGAAILVLESLQHARARGASILAELAGYAATSDAFHVTAPSADGIGGAAAIARAAKEAELNPDEIDYINAHGTATQLNDPAETRAIKAALGEAAYDVPVSSTKSMTGHMMGATGALEPIFCIKAIETNIAPPTIHLQEPDPECDLDYVPNEAREVPIETALSNAFGFGGHNAVLAFRSFSS